MHVILALSLMHPDSLFERSVWVGSEWGYRLLCWEDIRGPEEKAHESLRIVM